jgi:hypothetical protein
MVTASRVVDIMRLSFFFLWTDLCKIFASTEVTTGLCYALWVTKDA